MTRAESKLWLLCFYFACRRNEYENVQFSEAEDEADRLVEALQPFILSEFKGIPSK